MSTQQLFVYVFNVFQRESKFGSLCKG